MPATDIRLRVTDSLPWLRITADDFGLSKATSEGILECLVPFGAVNCVSVMVTHVDVESATTLKKMMFDLSLSLGLHFNVTQGRGLTLDHTLTLDGAALLTADEARAEFAAQTARFCELFDVAPMHVDCHQHVHRNPAVLTAILSSLGEGVRSTYVRSLDSGMATQIRDAGCKTCDDFVNVWPPQLHVSMSVFRAHMRAAVSSTRQWLRSGRLVEWMVHPGLVDDGLVEASPGYDYRRPIELLCLLRHDRHEWLELTNAGADQI
jgi:chitin disaccharide deacetylase